MTAYTGEMSEVLTSNDVKTLLHAKIDGMDYPSGLDPFAKVYNWNGSSADALYDNMPQMQSPSVVTWYEGSDWGDAPRRKQKWRLFVVVSCVAKKKASWESADNEAAMYVEDLVDVLTRIILDADARCDVVNDKAVVVDPAIAAYEIQVHVRDH